MRVSNSEPRVGERTGWLADGDELDNGERELSTIGRCSSATDIAGLAKRSWLYK